MEWDLKEFGWESAQELDQPKEESDLSAMVEFSTLKKQTTSTAAATSAAAAAAASKKANGGVGGGGGQKVSCLVDGCKSDLSGCREYHKRHRVCEPHSKTPIVVIKGEQKRFCQQCSRFHGLGEFDEVKRSCRKRLDGHNRRRRKSQPESLFFSSKAFLSSAFKGPKILHFGNPPHIYAPTTTTTSTSSAAASKVRNGSEPFVYGRQQRNRPPNLSNGVVDNNTQLFFLQENTHPEKGNQATTPEAFLNDYPFPSSTTKGHPTEVSTGCALYLLSSNPSSMQIPAGMGHHHHHHHHIVQSSDQTHHNPLPFLNSLSPFDHGKDNFNMILRMGPDGLLEHVGAPPQAFPI